MRTLPTPPVEVPAASRCVVHAACRGDHAAVEATLAARDARLRTLGHALGHPVLPPAPAAPARARVSLRPLPDGRLGQALPGTHDLRPVAWCGLLHPRLNQALAALPPLPPHLQGVELRTDGDRVVLAARSSQPRFAKGLAAALRALDLPVDAVAVDGRAVTGDPSLTLTVAGITHRLGPDTFTQVHLDVNADLVARVVQAVTDLGATAVLDLYAGCGNLGLPLAAAGKALTMIESSPAACADARRTALAHGLRVDIRQGDAGAFRAGDAFFDAAVLDPPRAGAAGLLSQLVLTRPLGLAFVCCNPGYLARDLRPALQAGYGLTAVDALDMFPLTEHVEVLALLARDR